MKPARDTASEPGLPISSGGLFMVFINNFFFQVYICIFLKIARRVETLRINRLRNRYLKTVDKRLKDGHEKLKHMHWVISSMRKR